MVNKAKVFAVGFLFLVNAGAALAEQSSLDRLLQLSGYTASIESMTRSLDHELSAEKLEADVGDPAFAAALSQSMRHSFNQELFDRRARQSISERLSDAEVEQLLAWYSTPLGKRVAAANQADQFEIAMRVEAGERPQISAERARLIETLDQLQMVSDRTVQLGIDGGSIIGHSMMSAMGMPISLDELRPMVEMQMMVEKSVIVEEVRASIGFLYESLTDDEFKNMIASLSDPEHTVFCDAIWTGLSHAFYEAGETIGVTLAAELNGGI